MKWFRKQPKKTKQILLAGGCFWCIEAAMRSLQGVADVVSGYAGEHIEGISYDDVVSHKAHAREAICVSYDVDQVSLRELLKHFFSKIDPLDAGGQFYDRGYSYTTAIYYQNDMEKEIAKNVIDELNDSGMFDGPIATTVEAVVSFVPAEAYHQNYKEKNPFHYSLYHEGSGRGAYERAMDRKKLEKN